MGLLDKLLKKAGYVKPMFTLEERILKEQNDIKWNMSELRDIILKLLTLIRKYEALGDSLHYIEQEDLKLSKHCLEKNVASLEELKKKYKDKWGHIPWDY